MAFIAEVKSLICARFIQSWSIQKLCKNPLKITNPSNDSLSWQVFSFLLFVLLLPTIWAIENLHSHKQHSWHFTTIWCKIDSAQSDKHLLQNVTEHRENEGK